MFISFLLLAIITFILCFVPSYVSYKSSKYGKISGNNYFQTRFSTGNYGEFLTFKVLENTNHRNRILTNLYLPKQDGTTTELDLLSITENGIFIFESKNYSGWIFGNEKRKFWTQTFKTGKKNKFLNPVWQNRAHINALKEVLVNNRSFVEVWQNRGHSITNLFGESGPIHSIIVFSKRCTLKKMNVSSSNVEVVKRGSLRKKLRAVNNQKVFSNEDIDSLYQFLGQYGLASKQTKERHIQQVKNSVKN